MNRSFFSRVACRLGIVHVQDPDDPLADSSELLQEGFEVVARPQRVEVRVVAGEFEIKKSGGDGFLERPDRRSGQRLAAVPIDRRQLSLSLPLLTADQRTFGAA